MQRERVMKEELRGLADSWDRIARADRHDGDEFTANRVETCAEELRALLAQPEAAEFRGEPAFKNFHHSLCARFGYCHDEEFWWRDLVSLEEHIAAQVTPKPEAADVTCEEMGSVTDYSFKAAGALAGEGDRYDPALGVYDEASLVAAGRYWEALEYEMTAREVWAPGQYERFHRMSVAVERAMQAYQDRDESAAPVAAQQPAVVGDGVPSIAAAEAMGANGAPPNEGERLAFEAWMRGHCWALAATWTGSEYVSDAEVGGRYSPDASRTRGLWAAWRDRAALTPAATPVPVGGEERCAHGVRHPHPCRECEDAQQGPAVDEAAVRRACLAYEAEVDGHVFGPHYPESAMRAALTAALAHPPQDSDSYYIQDTRQFVGNCPMWWCPDGKGYTAHLSRAGRYPKDEAMRIAASRATDRAWPCSVIDAIASRMVDMQQMPAHPPQDGRKGEEG